MDGSRSDSAARDLVTPDDLGRFQAGDPGLFRSLVEELSLRLLGYALNLTGDGDEAADLLQETWIQAYRRRATFRGEGPLLGWLVAITYHRFASDRRGEARRLARQVEVANTTDSIGAATIFPR